MGSLLAVLVGVRDSAKSRSIESVGSRRRILNKSVLSVAAFRISTSVA